MNTTTTANDLMTLSADQLAKISGGNMDHRGGSWGAEAGEAQHVWLPRRLGSFEGAVKRGPIFANIVLADEINRTTPRTRPS